MASRQWMVGLLVLAITPTAAFAQYGARGRQSNETEDIGGAILRGLIQGAAELERQNQNNNNNWNRNDRFNDDDYYPQQPQYRPQYRPQPQYRPSEDYYPTQPQPQPRVVPQATVRSNAPPKKVEKIVKAATNAAPSFGEGLGLTDAEHNLLTQVAQDKSTVELGKLKDLLGDAAKTPEVKEELKKLEEKIANGEQITDKDIDKLAQVADKTGMLPPGFNADDANKQADQLKKWSQIASSLAEESANGPTIPSGPVDVISVPTLPADDMVMLPDGTILIGTGGQGIVNVAQMDASDVLGVSVGVGEPVPDSDSDVLKRVKDGTLLINPEENGETISYLVSNNEYSMKAGYTHPLPAGTKWVVRFDRGGGGEAEYTLAEKTYVFGASDKGWELYARDFSVTIDNRGNDAAFNYNVDNKQCSVGPGEQATHTSVYPIYVRFDRGNGKESQKKVLAKGSYYRVAVDPSDSLWELYSGEQPQLASDEPARGKSGDRSSKTRAARLRALLLQTSKRE